MLQFYCPSCSTLIQVDDSFAGRQVKCSSCGSVVDAVDDRREPTALTPITPVGSITPAGPINPYAATNTASADPFRPDGNPSMVPGVCLMVLSGLWMGFLAILFVLGIVSMMNGVGNQDMGQVVSNFITTAILIAVHALIVYGGYSMTVCRNKATSLAACILALIPCCCSPFWVLGMPFGLWGLIVHERTPFDQS